MTHIRITLATALAVCTLTACNTTANLVLPSSPSEAIRTIEEVAGDEPITVNVRRFVMPEDTAAARALEAYAALDPDQQYVWSRRVSLEPEDAPLEAFLAAKALTWDDVLGASVTTRVPRGAGQGFLGGGALGAVLGAVVLGTDAASCTRWCFVSPGAAAALGGLAGGFVGGILGAVVGGTTKARMRTVWRR